MSLTKKITAGLIVATIVIWVGWDIYVAIEPTPGDTESETLRDWGWKAPAFVWAFGALCGHFWGTWGKFVTFREKYPWSPFVLGALALGLAGLNAAQILPRIHPMLSFLVGIPFGALLWPQKRPEPANGINDP